MQMNGGCNRAFLIELLAIIAISLAARAQTVLFQDDFAPSGGPSGTGPGSNWIAVAAGYPDAVNSRMLDGSRSVLRMQCSNITPAQQRGIQTSNAISIATVTDNLHVDLNFQPRRGGNSSITLQLTGPGSYVRVYTQDWVPQQVTTDGNGSGGSFSTNTGGEAYSFYSYYHFTIDVYSNATTITLLSDDGQTVLWRFTTDRLALSDFGSSVGLEIYQVTGAGIVENYIDNITVFSTTNTSGYGPGALALKSIPQIWDVHYVTNSSNTLLTMYGAGPNGGNLPTLQDFVRVMDTAPPKGMGHAFDPGPPLNGSYGFELPQVQYLAAQGFPSIAYSAIFLTNAISSSEVNLLNILDGAGLFTSVQFGEWGYHFHVDKPYGPYDGYPRPMTNRLDCYNFMKFAYQQQTADYRSGWANSVTGHSHYECYAAEWGCRMGGIEVGENIAFTQSKIAFARGASRQWLIPWSLQMSEWWDGYETTWQTLDYGHSLSLYQRMLLHGWFAGAAWLTPENSSDIDFNGDWATNAVNAWGVALSQLYAFINTHDRGTPYTPIAIVLDHYAGYNGYAHLSWGTLPFTAGDLEIDDLFVNQLFPGSDSIHYDPFPQNREMSYLRETPYGEIYDVVLSSASAPTLSSYPVLLLVGDMTFDPPFVSALQQALQNGSRLLMQASHQAALGSNFNTLTNAGAVEVLPLWTNSATGRAASIPNWRLSELSSAYVPIAVFGDPIQYSINRTAVGWVIELVHDSGVWKAPSNAAVVTYSNQAFVSLKACVPVAAAREWQIDGNGNASDTDLSYTGAPLTVEVGPGQTVYVEFTLLPGSGTALFTQSVTNNGYIYFDSFRRSGPLAGSSPDGANTGNAAWDADPTMQCLTNGEDGNVSGIMDVIPDGAAGNEDAYLPFTPQVGHLYTLSCDVDCIAGSSLGFGFKAFVSAANGDCWCPNTGPSCFESCYGLGCQDFWADESGSANTMGGPFHKFTTYAITLDTRPAKWVASWYMVTYPGDTNTAQLLYTHTYTSNPINIAVVGFYSYPNSSSAGYYDNFNLLDTYVTDVSIANSSLGIQKSGESVVITWLRGTLLQAHDLRGPWTATTNSSPYTIVPAGSSQMFYKVSVP